MKPTLFLSGPITGLSYNEVVAWRDMVRAELQSCGIICFSPMRGFKEWLGGETKIKESYQENPSGTDAAITDQDYFDVARCDVLMVNLLNTKEISKGTLFEIAWAYQLRKPLILVIEKQGNVHEHPMVRRAATYRVDTVADGIAIAKRLLLPD
jgi:nucleoside 2-deoxyribosyltransferase